MLTGLSDVYQLISQSLLNLSLWNISPLLYTMGLSDIHNTSVRAGNSEATVLYRPTFSVHSYLQADQLSMLLLSWGNLGKQIMSVCFLKFPWEILRWTWLHQCKHLFSKLLDSYLLRFLRKKNWEPVFLYGQEVLYRHYYLDTWHHCFTTEQIIDWGYYISLLIICPFNSYWSDGFNFLQILFWFSISIKC